MTDISKFIWEKVKDFNHKCPHIIYLDHASTTYIDDNVIDVIQDTLRFWGNPSNLYTWGTVSKELIEESRSIIAEAIGAYPDEIFFTSGASESNAWALAQKNNVVCSPYEHHNLINNPKSIIGDMNYLDRAVSLINKNLVMYKDYQNFLFSWMLVNNETGEIFPIKKIAEKVHSLDSTFHCDITQALGHMYVDVKSLDLDMATFTGHKIHAPKGIGVLYISEKYQKHNEIKPLIHGGIQEQGFRAGTENVAFICALAKALEIYTKPSQIDFNQKHCKHLKDIALKELYQSEIPFYLVSPENSVSNILNVAFKNISNEILMIELSERYNIFVGTGSACNTGEMEPSTVLQAMDVPKDYIEGAIRFSFDSTVSEYEVRWAVRKLVEIYKEVAGG